MNTFSVTGELWAESFILQSLYDLIIQILFSLCC